MINNNISDINVFRAIRYLIIKRNAMVEKKEDNNGSDETNTEEISIFNQPNSEQEANITAQVKFHQNLKNQKRDDENHTDKKTSP